MYVESILPYINHAEANCSDDLPRDQTETGGKLFAGCTSTESLPPLQNPLEVAYTEKTIFTFPFILNGI